MLNCEVAVLNNPNTKADSLHSVLFPVIDTVLKSLSGYECGLYNANNLGTTRHLLSVFHYTHLMLPYASFVISIGASALFKLLN